MKVFLTGGSGSIGRQIVARLVARGDEPVILSRRADAVRRDRNMRGIEVVQGDPGVAGEWQRAVDGCDAVVNLVGHGVFDDRRKITAEHRRQFRRNFVQQQLISPKFIAKAFGYLRPGFHPDDTGTDELIAQWQEPVAEITTTKSSNGTSARTSTKAAAKSSTKSSTRTTGSAATKASARTVGKPAAS